MIAVVALLQTDLQFIDADPELVGHHRDIICEIAVEFRFGNATECLIAAVEGDVAGLVETTEHTDLREFGDTRQKDETEILIGSLEARVECLQLLTVVLLHTDGLTVEGGHQV